MQSAVPTVGRQKPRHRTSATTIGGPGFCNAPRRNRRLGDYQSLTQSC